MTSREREILALLRLDPLIPQQALADQLGISRSAVAGHIMNLVQKGFIRGKGYILAEQRYAIVAGGANMDICGNTPKTLRFGDSNPGQVRCSPGGVARNIAENLARLGQDCYLVTAVGDDLYGRSLLESTQRAGVDTRATQVFPDAATSTYLSLHGPDGDMAIAINDMNILKRLTPERLASHRELIRHAGLLMLDTNLEEDTLAWLFAQSEGIPVFADTVSAFKAERIRPWLGSIHTLKPNRIEAEALSGRKLATKNDAPHVAEWFHNAGVARIVLSLAAQGVYFSAADGESGWMPPPDVEVVNATGAGDALMAGLAAGWLANDSFTDSLRFATGCAALTLTCPSTNNPALSALAVTTYLETRKPS